MITIDGNQFNISTLLMKYPRNSIESKLLVKMNQSGENYIYDSIDQLKFELLLRKETVKAAIDLNNSQFDFEIFRKSKCNPEYWNRTPNGGFKLKSGVKPSDAINDIYSNGIMYATECATAMIIVFYKALLSVFKEDLFNELFDSIYLMNWHSIDPLLKEIGTPKDVKDLLIGDRGYFQNPDVNPSTPEWQGENVIILPDDMYYGHGVGVRSAEKIIEELNEYRKRGSTRSAYLLQAASRPNYKKLYEIYSKSTAQTAALNWNSFPKSLLKFV